MIKLVPFSSVSLARYSSLVLLSWLFANNVLSQSALNNFQNVTLEELADPPAKDWLMWRRTGNHWGHSPLDQINKDNVSSLRLAFAWTMEPGLQETTALVRNGIMFLPQACEFIEAIDASDGTLLWEYRRPPVDHIASLS